MARRRPSTCWRSCIALLVTVLLVIGTSKSAKVNAVLVMIKVVGADRLHHHRRSRRAGRELQAVLPDRLGQPARRHRRTRRGGLDLLRLRRLRRGLDRGRRNQESEPQHPDRPDRLARRLHRVLSAGRLRRGRLGRRAADARCQRHGAAPGSPELAAACKGSEALVCSKEPLAHVLRMLGFASWGNMIGLAAALALPSVILMMIYGQTRIFFTMSRDGLLPAVLSQGAPALPHAARGDHHHRHLRRRCSRRCSRSACSPTSPTPARCSRSSWCRSRVMVLRKQQPDRPRPFRTPLVWLVCPLAIARLPAAVLQPVAVHAEPVLRLGGDRHARLLRSTATASSHLAPGNAAPPHGGPDCSSPRRRSTKARPVRERPPRSTQRNGAGNRAVSFCAGRFDAGFRTPFR